MTGTYIDFEGWEDDNQSITLPLPLCESLPSNVPEFAGNEESQVVPFATLHMNEESHPMPVSSVPSEYPDFKEYFQRKNGFGSREELQSWCIGVGKAHNFVIVCKSSKIKDLCGSAQGSWLQLSCERSGKLISHQAKNHVPKTTTKKRKCGSIKCGCPFRLNASCDKFERWNVRVGCGFHNHPIPTTLTGHAYAGRLAEEEKLHVIELTNSGCRPLEILTSIKNKYRNNYSTMRTINNARRKLKIYAMQGRTLMQHFFKLAQEHHYTVEYKFDPLTKKVQVTFIPYCITYINGETFTVAVAFMSREKEANYVWALKCVNRLYRDNAIPSVFVTDCEVGLISAIKHVFPTSSHLLCAWNIGKNVYAHGQKFFKINLTTTSDEDKPKKIDTIITQKEVKGKFKEKQDEKRKELRKWYKAWQDIVKSLSEEDY